MLGIKANLLANSIPEILKLIDFVGESCVLELHTEPRDFDKQKELAKKLIHPLLERVVVHSAAAIEGCPSDPLVNQKGYGNCVSQIGIVPEGGAIIFHPFGYGISPDKRWKTIEEDFRVTSEFANIAEEKNVGVLKENITVGYPFPHGRSAEDMEFLTRHSNIKMCLDFSHQGLTANYSGKDPYFREEWKRYLPHFDLKSFLLLKPKYFHVSDHKGTMEEGLEIGAGERDWSSIKGIDGVFVIEIKGQHENDFSILKKNLPRLRNVLAGKPPC